MRAQAGHASRRTPSPASVPTNRPLRRSSSSVHPTPFTLPPLTSPSASPPTNISPASLPPRSRHPLTWHIQQPSPLPPSLFHPAALPPPSLPLASSSPPSLPPSPAHVSHQPALAKLLPLGVLATEVRLAAAQALTAAVTHSRQVARDGGIRRHRHACTQQAGRAGGSSGGGGGGQKWWAAGAAVCPKARMTHGPFWCSPPLPFSHSDAAVSCRGWAISGGSLQTGEQEYTRARRRRRWRPRCWASHLRKPSGEGLQGARKSISQFLPSRPNGHLCEHGF